MENLNDVRSEVKKLGFTIVTKKETRKHYTYQRRAIYKHIETGQLRNTSGVMGTEEHLRWLPLANWAMENETKLKQIQELGKITGLLMYKFIG